MNTGDFFRYWVMSSGKWRFGRCLLADKQQTIVQFFDWGSKQITFSHQEEWVELNMFTDHAEVIE